MPDPTYDTDEIKSNPEWELAFSLSEIDNDISPVNWSMYIPMARCLLANYNITRKP